MDATSVPWKEGVEGIAALVLLKILYDAVYKKIPRGMRTMNASLQRLEAAALAVHRDHQEAMDALRACLEKVNHKKKPPRRPRTRRGSQGPFP